jgi:hypothetical protein
MLSGDTTGVAVTVEAGAAKADTSITPAATTFNMSFPLRNFSG